MTTIVLGILGFVLILYLTSGAWSILRRPQPTEEELRALLETLDLPDDDLHHVLAPSVPGQPDKPADCPQKRLCDCGREGYNTDMTPAEREVS